MGSGLGFAMSMSTAEAPVAGTFPVAPLEGALEREVRFPQGLPGFPGATRFLLEPVLPDIGLLRLASADIPELRFLVLAHAEGRLPLDPGDLEVACAELGIEPSDAAVLLVVTARVEPGSGRRDLSVNLRAPIFLDTAQRAAVQHVLPCPAYPVRHPLAT